MPAAGPSRLRGRALACRANMGEGGRGGTSARVAQQGENKRQFRQIWRHFRLFWGHLPSRVAVDAIVEIFIPGSWGADLVSRPLACTGENTMQSK